MSSISDSLQRARRSSKNTIKKLASDTGVSPRTITRIEQGEDVMLSTLEVLARQLGLSLMLVPISAQSAVQDFIQSGGKLVGQQEGVEAPSSIVNQLLGDTK